MADASKQLVVRFAFKKDTGGARRYQEVTEEGQAEKVGAFYLKNHALPGIDNAREITITITKTA